MALERIRRKAKADIMQDDAKLKAKTADLDRQAGKLAKINDQIKKSKIFAPAAGVVIYASSRKKGEIPLKEGQEVHERQELIYLQTTTSPKPK